MRKAKSQKVNLNLLEITILKKCLADVSHHVESLSDPILVVLSRMLDDRLNEHIKLGNK